MLKHLFLITLFIINQKLLVFFLNKGLFAFVTNFSVGAGMKVWKKFLNEYTEKMSL